MAGKSVERPARRNENRTGSVEKPSGEAGEESGAGTGSETGNAAGTETGASAGAETGTEKRTGKVDADNNAAVNPVSLAPDEYERDENGNVLLKANGEPRKKRGRKPGQAYAGAPKSKPAKTDTAKAAIATEMLAAQFQILNTGIAFMTKFEDYRLEDSEALQMAEAAANVMAQFDYVPDPKIAAVLGLVTTTSMIYGPRVYLHRKHLEKMRAERREKRIADADESATLYTGFPGGPNNMGQFSG